MRATHGLDKMSKIHQTHFTQPEMPYRVIERFRNKHAGETGLIVANGPSLNDVPDDFLKKYPTIGMNHIYERFFPTYYCLMGLDQVNTPEMRAKYEDVVRNADYVFFNRMALEDPQFQPGDVKWWNTNIIPILSLDRQGRKQGRAFSYDIEKRIGVGYTNTYPCMQIMFWLGFETVLCVGLDNNYDADPNKRHFYSDEPHNSCETLHGNEKFMVGSDFVFSLAAHAYYKHGRKLINLTPTETTPSLEMGNLEEWL